MVLRTVQERGTMSMLDLYLEVKDRYGMTYPVMLLSLDWLYLINAATVTKNGEVKLCI